MEDRVREIGGRREEIVRAASRRVAEAGFEGLRLRQIAEDVGIDHSTLHHHVRTKQDIIAGVADHTIRQFWTLLPRDVPPARALRIYLDNLRALIEERPELFVVTVELDLRARRDPAVAKIMHQHNENWRQVLRALLVSGNEAGTWAIPVDPDAGAELLIAATKGTRLAPENAAAVHAQLIALFTGNEAPTWPETWQAHPTSKQGGTA